MRPTLRTALLQAAAILAIAGIHGLAAQQPQPVSGLGSVHVAANEVLLDLVAYDSGNKPVLDLKPADLTATDNGQPITFSQFLLVNGNKQNPSLISLLFNRPGFYPRQGTSEEDAVQISRGLRDAASRFLKQFPESGFQFSAMDVWGRLQLQQEFTSDHKKISNAVSAAVEPGQYGQAIQLSSAERRIDSLVQTGKDAAGTALDPRALSLVESLDSAVVDSGRMAGEQHGTPALASLLALVQAHRQIPGRKAIVFFTTTTDLTGITPNKSDNNQVVEEAIQAIVGTANRVGVSIYIVRMKDLNTTKALGSLIDSFDSASMGSSNPGAKAGSRVDSHQQARAGQFASASEFRLLSSKQSEVAPIPGTLDSLVRGTGGYYFSDDESFSPPVKQLINDLTTYYETAYVPPSVNDGKFHTIEVKTQREGLRLRTRSGYLAAP